MFEDGYDLAFSPNTSSQSLDKLIGSITKQLREAEQWAVERFLEEHPSLSPQDIEMVRLQGNPYAYYVRKQQGNKE